MNILAKLGDVIESANHLDNESVIALGLFSASPATTDSRSAPAFGVFTRRKERQHRNFW